MYRGVYLPKTLLRQNVLQRHGGRRSQAVAAHEAQLAVAAKAMRDALREKDHRRRLIGSLRSQMTSRKSPLHCGPNGRPPLIRLAPHDIDEPGARTRRHAFRSASAVQPRYRIGKRCSLRAAQRTPLQHSAGEPLRRKYLTGGERSIIPATFSACSEVSLGLCRCRIVTCKQYRNAHAFAWRRLDLNVSFGVLTKGLNDQ